MAFRESLLVAHPFDVEITGVSSASLHVYKGQRFLESI